MLTCIPGSFFCAWTERQHATPRSSSRLDMRCAGPVSRGLCEIHEPTKVINATRAFLAALLEGVGSLEGRVWQRDMPQEFAPKGTVEIDGVYSEKGDSDEMDNDESQS